MRLSIKKRGQAPQELRFKIGPIYIGRQVGSQVFLPDRSVSRQHSVIYQDVSNQWMIEDLESTNKTFVNNTAVHKSPIKDNDIIKVGDFTVRVMLNEDQQTPVITSKEPIRLDDTIADEQNDAGLIVRQTMSKNAPPLTLLIGRIKDFQKALKLIFDASSIKDLHSVVINLLQAQFGSHNAWAAITTEQNGPMMIEAGRTISSQLVQKEDLVMYREISIAVEKQKYILMPQIKKSFEAGRVRSLMIAPILQKKNNLGVIYTNNTAEHQRYEPADLDYLMLLTMLIAQKLSML